MVHYKDDVVFRSAKAQVLVGQGTLNGKAELRAYWSKALARQPNLKFTVLDVFVGHEMLVLTYRNQNNLKAAETLRFASDGLVIEASACHRAT